MDSVTRCPVHKKATEILEEVAADICNNYCKYPEKYAEYEDMLDEQCKDCPLNKLT